MIAFLNDFYVRTYGYRIEKILGLAASEDGSRLVVVGNGRFTDPKAGEKGFYRTERRPSVLVLEIPAGERA